MNKKYWLYTSKDGINWRLDAVVEFPDYVYDEDHLRYLSHIAVFYKVQTREAESQRLLDEKVFPPCLK